MGGRCGVWERVRGVGAWGGVCGVCNTIPLFFDCEAVTTLAPLYYPDTLVNPDTCLGH